MESIHFGDYESLLFEAHQMGQVNIIVSDSAYQHYHRKSMRHRDQCEQVYGGGGRKHPQ